MDDGRRLILITGSSGLLGHALSHHFASKDCQVVGFDMIGPPYPPPKADCLFCDLTSDESMQKTFYILREKYGRKIDAVIHLAAYYSFSGKPSPLYKNLTVDGTGRLIRELQNFDVGQFIFSSSMLVYKPNESGVALTEASPVERSWDYPNSKIDTEHLLKSATSNFPIVSLRIAGVYSNDCQSIPLAHQIQRIYENRLEGHLYSGSVDVRQSFVHLHDLVAAVEACIQRKDTLPAYSVFNIGEDPSMSYDEIQRQIASSLFGTHWNTFEVPKEIAKPGAWVEQLFSFGHEPFIRPWMIDHADDNYQIDISKARTQLLWQPEHSLKNTLPQMVEGLLIDPKRWYEINHLGNPPAHIAAIDADVRAKERRHRAA